MFAAVLMLDCVMDDIIAWPLSVCINKDSGEAVKMAKALAFNHCKNYMWSEFGTEEGEVPELNWGFRSSGPFDYFSSTVYNRYYISVRDAELENIWDKNGRN